MTRVPLAPDKFKGTLTAAEVAGHLADGIRSAAPATDIVTVPVSDGGDGLLAAFAAKPPARKAPPAPAALPALSRTRGAAPRPSSSWQPSPAFRGSPGGLPR
jgi:glycerate kinase